MIGRIEHSRAEVVNDSDSCVCFRDGTFGEVRMFPSWFDALEAVGLEECGSGAGVRC